MIKKFLSLILLLFCITAFAQNNTVLLDSAYFGNKAWRISYSGSSSKWMLETSTNKGKAWSRIEHRTSGLDTISIDLTGMHPSKIHFINDSTGFAFGQFPVYGHSYFILRTSNGGKEWALVDGWRQLGTTNRGNKEDLKGLAVDLKKKFIHFSDKLSGFLFIGHIDKDLVFLQTKDAGRTWNSFKLQTNLSDKYFVSSMKFLDPWYGDMVLKQANSPMVVKLSTTDGGKTWQLLPGTSDDVALHMDIVLDTSRLSDGSVYKLVPDSTREGWSVRYSVDNGKTWAKIKHKVHSAQKSTFFPIYSTPNRSVVNKGKVHFVNKDHGFILCSYGYYMNDYVLLQTTDAGKTWSVVDHYPTNVIMKDQGFKFDVSMKEMIHFSDGDHGIVYIGASGGALAFLRMKDGSGTWEYFTIPAGGFEPYSMIFSDPMHGEIILHSKNVVTKQKLVTKDGGMTWKLK